MLHFQKRIGRPWIYLVPQTYQNLHWIQSNYWWESPEDDWKRPSTLSSTEGIETWESQAPHSCVVTHTGKSISSRQVLYGKEELPWSWPWNQETYFWEGQKAVGKRDCSLKRCPGNLTCSKAQGRSRDSKLDWVWPICSSWRGFQEEGGNWNPSWEHRCSWRPLWGTCSVIRVPGLPTAALGSSL